MAGSVFHTVVRRLTIIVAAGVLFGCAGQPVRPLPEKAAVGAGPKKGVEARVSPAKPGKEVKAAAKKTSRAARSAVAEQPAPDRGLATESALPDASPAARPVFLYDYYPDREVYFDTGRHLYFYRTGGEWHMSVALPISFQAHLGKSVQLKLDSPRPYEYHDRNRKAFPSGAGGRDF